MKVRNYKFVMLFAFLSMLLIIENAITTNNTSNKIIEFENNTLECFDEYVDDLINYKKNMLSQLSKKTMDDNNIKSYLSHLYELDEESDLYEKNIDVDFIIYTNKGNIYYNVNGSSINYEFTIEELNEFKSIYENCSTYPFFYNTKKWINVNDNYELLFGLPIYDSNYDIYGVVISRLTSQEFTDYLNEIIDGEKIYIKVTSNDEIIAEVNPELANSNKKFECENYCNKTNICTVISISNNDIFTGYYGTFVILVLNSIIITIIYYFLGKKYKDKFPIASNLIVIILMILANVHSIVSFKMYDQTLSDIKINTFRNMYINEMKLYYDDITRLSLQINNQIKKDVINNDSINELNVLDYVLNKYKKNIYTLMQNNSYLGHVYFFDNENMMSLPNEDNYNYLNLHENIYKETLKNENSSNYYLAYDNDHNCNVVYLNVPIIKNKKVILIISYVFEYDAMKNTTLSKTNFDAIEKIFIDKDYNVYYVNDNNVEYQKKYFDNIEVISDNNKIDNKFIYECNAEYNENGLMQEYDAIYCEYLKSVILIKDTDKVGWAYTLFKIFYAFILTTMAAIIVGIDDIKNVKAYFMDKKLSKNEDK